MDIEQFTKRILAIQPNTRDFLGGSAFSEGAGQDVSAGIIYEMRQAAMAFVRAYDNPATSTEELQTLASEIEGRLLTAATIMQFEPSLADELVDALHRLVAEKSSPATA